MGYKPIWEDGVCVILGTPTHTMPQFISEQIPSDQLGWTFSVLQIFCHYVPIGGRGCFWTRLWSFEFTEFASHIPTWAPEWRSSLRHCISVQEASLQSLVRIQAVSHPAVIGSPIGRRTGSSGVGRNCKSEFVLTSLAK